MSETNSETGRNDAEVPQPEEVSALDEFDGDELHKDEYIGEEVSPADDPNIQEHYRG